MTAPDPLAPVGHEPLGPVPEDNLPGHHPVHEQDVPDLDAMAERLGTKAADPTEDRPRSLRLVDHVITPPAAALQVGADLAGGFARSTLRLVGGLVGNGARRFGDEVLRLTQ